MIINLSVPWTSEMLNNNKGIVRGKNKVKTANLSFLPIDESEESFFCSHDFVYVITVELAKKV